MNAAVTVAPAYVPTPTGHPWEAADGPLSNLLPMPWDGDGRMRYAADPADVSHDNTRRAGWAVAALAAYANAADTTTTGQPVEQLMIDMVGGLLHLADATGADQADIIARAEYDHRNEVQGKP